MVGGKKALFMDEISTGLDSATTFLITKCLSNFCHILEGTLLVALLQPPPETYNLFDDVMLLSQGQVVFHGPREEVRAISVTESALSICPDKGVRAVPVTESALANGPDKKNEVAQTKHLCRIQHSCLLAHVLLE